MKKSILLSLLVLLQATIVSTFAQTCPTIVPSSFHINSDVANPCLKTVSFDFINPTNGQKRINVTVTVANVEALNICYDASGQKDVQRSITTPSFVNCAIGDLKVSITPYSGSTCTSTGCAPTLFSIGGGSLPVIFNSFIVHRNKENVTVNWSTATEMNSRGFILERNDKGNWQQVAFIATKAIDGNSSSLLSYDYNDLNTNTGMTQYRIKQVDIDGNYKYSDIRSIQGTTQDGKTTVFPNPSNDGKVNIVFNNADAREIKVVDMAGRTIRQYHSFTANSLQITDLNPGLYMIHTNSTESGETTINKVMIATNK